MSGLNLLTFEVYAEVEFKGNLRSAVEDTYLKIKQFLPNLPDDLQDLCTPSSTDLNKPWN